MRRQTPPFSEQFYKSEDEGDESVDQGPDWRAGLGWPGGSGA